MDLLFDAIDAIDIDVNGGGGGGVDAPELAVEGPAVSLAPLPRLSKSIAFLDGKLDVTVHYDAVPAQIDWGEGRSIQDAIPILSGCGTRQVPQCLLLDAATAMDKLVVTNWWRGLPKERQIVENDALKRVYRTFTSSNEKLINDHWENTRNSIESRPAAAALIDDTSNVYIGSADKSELREAGMVCTVSARVAKKRKGTRKVSDPPTSPSHVYDKTTRTALVRMEKSVNNVNKVTNKPEDATFKGGIQAISIVLRDTGTPKANGKLSFENRVRKRPKMEVYGLRGEMDDPTNTVANLLQAFVVEAKKICDVVVVPHGQEPPTQQFNRSRRRRNKTRPLDELDAEMDAHVASGSIQGCTISLDGF
jgi:hypothetical protein